MINGNSSIDQPLSEQGFNFGKRHGYFAIKLNGGAMINSSQNKEISTDPLSIGLLHPLIYIMIPKDARAAVTSLWHVDAEMASIMRNVQDPHLQLMRLIWWRDQLEALEAGKAAPTHPVLQAVEQAYVGRNDKEGLHVLADIWADFAEEPQLNEAAVHEFATRRGKWLFTRSAALLNKGDTEYTPYDGHIWGLNDVASHMSDKKLAATLRKRSLEEMAPPQARAGVLKSLAASTKLAHSRARSEGVPQLLREQALLLRISLFGA